MRLPDHHVLGVELIRTRHDETAAVFTIVRNGEPVQAVVYGDARGRLKPNQDMPRDPDGNPCSHEHALVARRSEARAPAGAPLDGDYGDASPDGMAIGEPPVKQPVTPGMIAVGGVMLSTAFDVTEQLSNGGTT